MQKNKLVKTIASGYSVIIFFVLFIVIYILINGKPFGVARLTEITDGVGILDMKINYNTDTAYDHFDALGTDGRSFRLKYITPLDLIFPILYTLFFMSLLLFLYKKNNFVKFSILCFIPFLPMLFDYLENICIITALINYPERLPSVIALSNLFTLLKFTFLTITFVILLINLFFLIFNKILTIKK